MDPKTSEQIFFIIIIKTQMFKTFSLQNVGRKKGT